MEANEGQRAQGRRKSGHFKVFTVSLTPHLPPLVQTEI